MSNDPRRAPDVRCVLFDLDGTLVDSRADITSAMDATLVRFGLTPLGPERVGAFVGDGARLLVSRALGFAGGESLDVDAVLAAYLEEYRRTHLDRTCLYPGVAETLEALGARGVAAAVVTNKPHEFSQSLLDHLGVGRHFRAVIGGDTLPQRKPRPEPLLAALASCGADSAHGAMVGDGEPDLVAGRAAGVFTVGVTYGFRDAATLAATGADAFIDAMPELLRVLRVSP